jgi:hypothetical protein
MRTVQVIDKKTGKVVAKYPISLRGENYSPTDDEYFKEAWKAAIEDAAVQAKDEDKYSFAFA